MTARTSGPSDHALTPHADSVVAAVLAWGAHIATRMDWGAAYSAVSINGSPFHRDKPQVRRDLVADRARSNGVVLAYVNQVGGQDELVFDGGSLVADARGNVVAHCPYFAENLLVVDIDSGSASCVDGGVDADIDDLTRVYDALVLGTRDYVRKNGFTDVVIGLSGGIDSALVAAIAVDALGAALADSQNIWRIAINRGGRVLKLTIGG